MRKFIQSLILSGLLFNMSICNAYIVSQVENENYIFVTEEYRVQKDDTLDSITYMFIKKNTYSYREFDEFKEGIKENNPQLIYRDVEENELLTITYWQHR